MTGKTLKELDVKPGDVVAAQEKYTIWINSVGQYCEADDERPLSADEPIWSIVSRATPDAPVMTLPDGTTLREGDYAKLRNGNVVGPMQDSTADAWPWIVERGDGKCWRNDGTAIHGTPQNDIIARATNPRTAKAVAQLDDTPKTWGDMTDAEKGALLLAHHEGKIICMFNPEGLSEWVDPVFDYDLWDDTCAYRIKPEPKRETVTIRSWEVVKDVLPEGWKIVFEYKDGKPDRASIKMNEVE